MPGAGPGRASRPEISKALPLSLFVGSNMKISLRDVGWLTLVVGLSLALWLQFRERQRLSKERDDLVQDGFVQGADMASAWWAEKVSLIDDQPLKSQFQNYLKEQPIGGTYTLPEDREADNPPLRGFGVVRCYWPAPVIPTANELTSEEERSPGAISFIP